MSWKRGLVVVAGVLAMGALACASGGSTGSEMRTVEGTSKSVVLIQVNPDCTVDKEEAHVSESKGEQARWKLLGGTGALAIEFKEEKGKNAFDVAKVSDSESSATVKAKEYGPHPYRIIIDGQDCPDPVLIIDP